MRELRLKKPRLDIWLYFPLVIEPELSSGLLLLIYASLLSTTDIWKQNVGEIISLGENKCMEGPRLKTPPHLFGFNADPK